MGERLYGHVDYAFRFSDGCETSHMHMVDGSHKDSEREKRFMGIERGDMFRGDMDFFGSCSLWYLDF